MLLNLNLTKKNKHFILFLILILGLLLSSFLGVGFNSYTGYSRNLMNINLKEGLDEGVIYYGPNGSSAKLVTNSDGTTTIQITKSDGTITTYTNTNTNTNTYYGENGYTATIKTNTSGTNTTYEITIMDPNGNTETVYKSNTGDIYTSTNISDSNVDNYNHYNGTINPVVYYGPNNSIAKIININGTNQIVVTNKDGSTNVYLINSDNQYNDATNVKVFYGQDGSSAQIVQKDGKQVVKVTTTDGDILYYYTDYNMVDVNNASGAYGGEITQVETASGNTYTQISTPYSTPNNINNINYNDYYNSLPKGIPKRLIPKGQEDLYILKSQVVPPVCPVCPNPIYSEEFNAKRCPPCPPCARCPEPAFDCKKVPNYNAFNPNYLPIPVLNDFSQFGM